MANRLDPAALEAIAPEDESDNLDELVSAIIEHDPKLTDLLVAIAVGRESKSKLITRIQDWSEEMGGCTKEELAPVANSGGNVPGWLS